MDFFVTTDRIFGSEGLLRTDNPNFTNTNTLAYSTGNPYESQLYNNNLTNPRNLEASNPELIYKIKIGNFLPDSLYKRNFQFLYSTLNSKSISGYKADWFLSNDLVKTLGDDMLSTDTKFNFISNFVHLSESSLINSYFKNLTNYQLKTDSIVSLFFTQSKQVRTLSN